MEARFDAAAMLALSIVLLAFSAVVVNADIPDDVVYTDVRKVVIEGDDAVLKCQFRETPLAIYWKKGSDPESSPNVITRVKDLPPTGCVEDGACEMDDDFSLILKEVEMEDKGRYICRVVNHKGTIIHNFTDVKVIDPDGLRIHTEPRVMEWAGSAVNLPCSFTVEAQKVLWKRVYGNGGSTDEIILKYTSDGHEVPGAGRYSWSKSYGLIIRNLQVSDEGKFTCYVLTIDGIKIESSTVLVVKVSATKSIISMTASIFSVLGIVFLVLSIRFGMRRYRSSTNSTNNQQRGVFLLKKPDKFDAQKDQQADIEQLLNHQRRVFLLKKPDEFDAQKEQQADIERQGLNRQQSPTILNKPDKFDAQKEQQADIERQGLMERETRLDNLRKQLKNYQPGNATNRENTERFQRVINLGVFGAVGVGKSSLINSISFALKSTFVNVVSRVSGGGEGDFTGRICLTKHISILDNRGMKDLSERQIRDSLLPRIRGERGLDPDDGVVTHCPIFVHDIRKPFDPMCIFLQKFTGAVHKHYGRHVMVVFTHTNTVENPDFNISRTRTVTGIPKEHIWSFENYTENNIEDIEKNIEYLKFLQKCLEIGEKNIHT